MTHRLAIALDEAGLEHFISIETTDSGTVIE